MKQTDIVATIGPASNTLETLVEMIQAGATVLRLNFAWIFDDEEALERIALIREAAKEAGMPVSILADLPGRRVQETSGHTFDPQAEVLTEHDKKVIAACASQGVEYIALSFILNAQEVASCTEYIRTKGSVAKIIAKIERQEAVDDIEQITQVTDGVMVARGDLGDNLPYETLPFVQKIIVDACVAAEIPVIVATQMMLTMTENPTPSRAEVTDVALAVLQGATGVMLSEESAKGKYPVEAVRAMRRIVSEAQKYVAQDSVDTLGVKNALI